MEKTITNQSQYQQGYNGTALKVIFVKGEDPKAENVAARGSGFSWQVATPVSQADEINSRIVKETNYGRQELGTGTVDIVFNLQANDAMPTAQDLSTVQEMTIFEVTGDDHPMTSQESGAVVLNVFLGARIVNKASGDVVNQQKMLNVNVVFREHLTGLQWKARNAATLYPAEPAV
jgi:hypothetical protein